MKQRTGFVSNSSSSSFVIVAKKSDIEEALAELHPFVRWWIRKYLKKDTLLADENTIQVIKGYFDTSDGFPYWDLEEYTGEIFDQEKEISLEVTDEDTYTTIERRWETVAGGYWPTPIDPLEALTIFEHKLKEKGKKFISLEENH